MPEAQPYMERGYADSLAASLRQARAVAVASGCDVRFTINAAGYTAEQHGNSLVVANHCATGGGWDRTVRRGSDDLAASMPAGVTLAVDRQFVFSDEGTVAGGPYNITVGPHVIVVEASGLVH